MDSHRDSVRCQSDSLALSTDGTYKLHFGGWTLVDCGSVTVSNDRGKYAHRFMPTVYMFVRSECAEAYEHMFDAMIKFYDEFYGLQLEVASVCIDHSTSIAKAVSRVWPSATIIKCWLHLVQNARDTRKLLKNPDNFDAVILPDI